MSRQPKSVSNETTFEEDTSDLVQLGEHITRLAQRVSERLQRRGLAGRTVVLKLTYRNFQHVTRRTTLTAPTSDAERHRRRGAGTPGSERGGLPARAPGRRRRQRARERRRRTRSYRC